MKHNKPLDDIVDALGAARALGRLINSALASAMKWID
jgi:hypothetical protein